MLVIAIFTATATSAISVDADVLARLEGNKVKLTTPRQFFLCLFPLIDGKLRRDIVKVKKIRKEN